MSETCESPSDADEPTHATVIVTDVVLWLTSPDVLEGLWSGQKRTHCVSEHFRYFPLVSHPTGDPYIYYTTFADALKLVSPLLISKGGLDIRKKTITNMLQKGMNSETCVFGYVQSDPQENLFANLVNKSQTFSKEEFNENFLFIPTATVASTLFTYLGEVSMAKNWSTEARTGNYRSWQAFAIDLISLDAKCYVEKCEPVSTMNTSDTSTESNRGSTEPPLGGNNEWSFLEYDDDIARYSLTAKGKFDQTPIDTITSQDKGFTSGADMFSLAAAPTMPKNALSNEQYESSKYPVCGANAITTSCADYYQSAQENPSNAENVIILWQHLTPEEQEIFSLAHLHLIYSWELFNVDQSKKVEQIKLRFQSGCTGKMYNTVMTDAVKQLVYTFNGISEHQDSSKLAILDNKDIVYRYYLEILERFGFKAKTTQFHYALVPTELFPNQPQVKAIKAKVAQTSSTKGVEQENSTQPSSDIPMDIVETSLVLFDDILITAPGRDSDDLSSEEDEDEEIQMLSLLDDLNNHDEPGSVDEDQQDNDIIRNSKVMMTLQSTTANNTKRSTAIIPQGYGICKQHIFGATNVFIDPHSFVSMFINNDQVRDYLDRGHGKKINSVIMLNLILTWDAADLTNVSLTQANECFSALFLQCTNMIDLSNSHLSNFLVGLNNQQDKGPVVRRRFYKKMIEEVFKLNGKKIGCENQMYQINILPFILADYGLAKVLGGNESFDKQLCLGSPYNKLMLQSMSHTGYNLGNDDDFDLNSRLELDYKVAVQRLLSVLLQTFEERQPEEVDKALCLFFPFTQGSLCSMIFHAAFDHVKVNKPDIRLGPLEMSALTLPPDYFHIIHNVGKHQLEKNSYISQKLTGNKTQVRQWQQQLKEGAVTHKEDSENEEGEEIDDDAMNVEGKKQKKVKKISSTFTFIGDPGKSNSAPIGLRAGMSNILYNQTPLEAFYPPNFAGSDDQGKLIRTALIKLTNTLKRSFHLLGEKDPVAFRESQGYMLMLLDVYDTQYTSLYGAGSILPYDILFAHTLQYFINEVINLDQTYIATFNTNPNEANHPRIIEKFRKGGNHFTTPTPLHLQHQAILEILKANFFEHIVESTHPTFDERLRQSRLREEAKISSRMSHPTLIESDLQQKSFVSIIHRRFDPKSQQGYLCGDATLEANYVELIKSVLTINEIRFIVKKSIVIKKLWLTGRVSEKVVQLILSYLSCEENEDAITLEQEQNRKFFSADKSVVTGSSQDFRGPYPEFSCKAEETMSSLKAEHHDMINLKSNKKLFSLFGITYLVAEENNLYSGSLVFGIDFNNQSLKLTLHINVDTEDGDVVSEQYVIIYKLKCVRSIDVTLLIENEPLEDAATEILENKMDRIFLTVNFIYGPFSITKKVTQANRKVLWEKVDKIPFNNPSDVALLHSQLRIVCLVQNKPATEFLDTLVRPLAQNYVGSSLRSKITHNAQYLFQRGHQGIKNLEATRVTATQHFLENPANVIPAIACPLVFPPEDIDEDNERVVPGDMPILTHTSTTARRVECESFKELIYCMASEEERKFKFQRRCRCGCLLYISTKKGGNFCVEKNEIHNKCTHIPDSGCCPL